MALGTYAELQASIANWMARSGDPIITAIAPDAIAMAEADFNLALRVGEMEETATITGVSGVFTLPTDFQAARSVSIAGYGPLKLVTPEWAKENYPVNQGGTPAGFYTIKGQTLTTYPAYTGDVSLDYYASIPALSDANTTNWLLTLSPQLYLARAMGWVNAFIKDAGAAGAWFSQADTILAQIASHDVARRYSNAAVRVKGPTP